MIKKKEEAKLTQRGQRFGHETGRHGSVRSKNQIDVSPRTRCVVLKLSWKSQGNFLRPWSSRVGTNCTETTVLGVKRVAVAPFELKIGPNESYGHAASVKPLPEPKRPRFEPKF